MDHNDQRRIARSEHRRNMCQRSRVYGVYGKSVGHVSETDANYRGS